MRKCKTFFRGVAVIATCMMVALAGCAYDDDEMLEDGSGIGGGGGSAITLTYRELSEAKVGDIIFKNGKVLSASEITSDIQKDAIAVVYKVDTENNKAWAVGKKHEKKYWCYSGKDGNKNKIDKLITRISGSGDEMQFIDYTDGSTGLQILKDAVTDYNVEYYSAWEYCANYGATHCIDTKFTTGWYFPSYAEVYEIDQANKDSGIINTALAKSGGDTLTLPDGSSKPYFTSSEWEHYYIYEAVGYYFSSHQRERPWKSRFNYVCPVRAFTW